MRILISFVLVLVQAIPCDAQDLAQVKAPDPEIEKLFREGEQAYNVGGYVKAISYFDQVIQRDPDHLNAYLQRGFCHSLQRDYAKAVADFTE